MDRRLYLTAAAGVLVSACTAMQSPSPDWGEDPSSESRPTPRPPEPDAITAGTRGEFLAALETAQAGETVLVPPDASIDLEGVWGVQIPAGVTVSGSRGADGTDGALLRAPPGDEAPRNSRVQVKLELGEGARLTGFRLHGHHMDYVNPAEAHDGDFYAHRGGGIQGGRDTVIDNNDIAGWPYAGVVAEQNCHVHHNTIRNNTWEGLGYGVAIPPGDQMPVIEFNHFNYNRHSISGAGGETVGYLARYNVVGRDWVGSQFDMHGSNGLSGIAGDRIEIHNNTFQATNAVEAKSRNPGGQYPAIQIRGTPVEGVWVSENWFYHDDREGAFRQPEGANRAYFENNHYGQSRPESLSVGAPRSHV